MTVVASGILNSLKERKESWKISRDEYDSFGEHVAFKIRKLNTNCAKEVVEHMINAILFEASIGKYDHPAVPFSALFSSNSVYSFSSW
jgi:hypothetical protein